MTLQLAVNADDSCLAAGEPNVVLRTLQGKPHACYHSGG